MALPAAHQPMHGLWPGDVHHVVGGWRGEKTHPVVGLGGVLVCSFLGGMRAITWTQVAQYIVLIVAYLMPVIWLSVEYAGLTLLPASPFAPLVAAVLGTVASVLISLRRWIFSAKRPAASNRERVTKIPCALPAMPVSFVRQFIITVLMRRIGLF